MDSKKEQRNLGGKKKIFVTRAISKSMVESPIDEKTRSGFCGAKSEPKGGEGRRH